MSGVAPIWPSNNVAGARTPWLQRSRSAILLAITLLGIAYLAGHDPSVPGNTPPCPFRVVTGYRCPGCGTLRALHHVLQGNIAAAARLNILAVLALPLAFWIGLSHIYALIWARPPASVRFPPWVYHSVLLVILSYWVARNVPVRWYLWYGS